MNAVNDAISRLGGKVSFSSEPVEDDVLNTLISAARVAPSADNVQMWRFIVVRGEEGKKSLLNAIPGDRKPVFEKAPVLIAALGDPWFVKGSRSEQPFFMIDVPIGISHIVLQAAEIGLGCELEFEIDEEKVKKAVNASKEHRAVAVIAVGKRPI